MNIKITYHILPWEIDYALLTFSQLKKSKYYLPTNINITIDSVLNLSSAIINWETSKLPKEFFIEKYKTISLLLKDYKHNQKIVDTNELYGHLDLQRNSVSTDTDYYISICPDMYFSEHLLAYLIQSIQTINNEYFVITPQICRMWDNSWDVIVNPNFAKGSYENHEWLESIDIFDVNHYLHNNNESIMVVPTESSKWAGWFDVYNKKFFEELAPIPTEWSGYGGWDYYSIAISEYAKQLNKDFKQYCLHGQIIFEYGCGPLRTDNINGFSNYYKDLLTIADISEQRDNFNKNLPTFLNKQIKKLYEE
jgi:hypothetical protein